MSILRELLIKIRGDASGIENASNRAQAVLTKLGGVATKVGTVMAAGLAAGVAAAGAALIGAAKSALAYGDELDKLSKQLGMSTQAVAGLRYAAEQGGVEFGALTSSINLMKRNLAEAAVAGGPVRDVLNSMGLSAKALAQMTPEQQLNTITEALGNMGAGANQTSAAFAIFGRGAASVLPLLKEGTANIAEMRAEAERLGLALSATDTAALDAAGDSVASLQASVQGLANKVGVELAPYIQMGAEAFRDYFFVPLQRDIPRLWNAFMDFGEGVEGGIKIISGRMAAYFKAGVAGIVSGGVQALQAFLGWAESQLSRLPFVNMDGKSNVGQGVLDKARALQEEAKADLEKANSIGSDDTVFGRLKKKAQEMREGYQEEGKKTQKALETVQGAIKEVGNEADKTKEKLEIMWDDDFQKKWEADLQRAREQLLSTYDPAVRGVERYVDSLKEARKNNEDIAQAAEHAMQGLEDAFVTAATTGKLSFKDMANSIIADIARIMVRRSITEPLGNALSSFISSAISGGFGGGGTGVGAKANGGPVTGGSAYVVGERGPELFVPSTSGTVVPNDQMQNSKVGSTVMVQQTLNIGLGVQEGVRQQLQAMMPTIQTQTVAAVQASIERGGTMARTVGRR